MSSLRLQPMSRRLQVSARREPRIPIHERIQRLTSSRSDEKEIASVHAASDKDVDIAVAAARKALKDPSWADMSTTDRGNMMIKLADLVEANKEILATIETWDNGQFEEECRQTGSLTLYPGKPYTVARDEDLAEVSGCLKYYGGWADKIHGQVIDTSPAKFAYTVWPGPLCGCYVLIQCIAPAALGSMRANHPVGLPSIDPPLKGLIVLTMLP